MANYEQTRWFLVLRLEQPAGDALNSLLWVSNKTALEFDQPSLYMATESPSGQSKSRGQTRAVRFRGRGGSSSFRIDHPAPPLSPQDCSRMFHVSIAWSPTPPVDEMLKIARSANLAELRQIRLPVRRVKVKIGNAITSFLLTHTTHESRGILGS